jgi:hypothetical protein
MAKDALEALREGKTAEAAALLGAIADSPDPARAILAEAEQDPLPNDAIRARGRLIAEIALGLARANPTAYWGENMRGLDLRHVSLSEDAKRLLHGCEFLAAQAAQKGGGA